MEHTLIRPKWGITAPGEHTAFCPKCDVELGLTEIRSDTNNSGGRQDYICPECKTLFD